MLCYLFGDATCVFLIASMLVYILVSKSKNDSYLHSADGLTLTLHKLNIYFRETNDIYHLDSQI